MYSKQIDLEWYLVGQGIVTDSELDEDPRVTATGTSKLSPQGVRGIRSGGYRTGGTQLSDDDDDDENED